MSGAVGTVRKIFDVSPTSISSNGNYGGAGSTSSWSTGLLSDTGTPGTNSNCWLTSNWQQSTNDNGRVGISVACESLDLRLKITPDPTVVGYQHIRMILFADNECDGAAPAFAELLGDTNGAATAIASGLELSFLQPAYLGRFQILEDKNWIIYSSSTANTFTEMKTPINLLHESHHDLHGHRIMWDTTDALTSAITNARKGHIFMYFMFSSTDTASGVPVVTTANPPAIQYAARFRYRDA